MQYRCTCVSLQLEDAVGSFSMWAISRKRSAVCRICIWRLHCIVVGATGWCTTLDTNRGHGMNARPGSLAAWQHARTRWRKTDDTSPPACHRTKKQRPSLSNRTRARHHACLPGPLSSPRFKVRTEGPEPGRVYIAYTSDDTGAKTSDESRDVAPRCSSDLSVPTRRAVWAREPPEALVPRSPTEPQCPTAQRRGGQLYTCFTRVDPLVSHYKSKVWYPRARWDGPPGEPSRATHGSCRSH